jgi:hypothetical protein
MFLLICYKDFENQKPFFIGLFRNIKNIYEYSNGYIKHCDLYPKNKKRRPLCPKNLYKIYTLPKNIK